MLTSFRAVLITEFRFGLLPQVAAIKKKLLNFYLFPVSVGQVCSVLVLTSTNRQARNQYPEMVMALTGS